MVRITPLPAEIRRPRPEIGPHAASLLPQGDLADGLCRWLPARQHQLRTLKAGYLLQSIQRSSPRLPEKKRAMRIMSVICMDYSIQYQAVAFCTTQVETFLTQPKSHALPSLEVGFTSVNPTFSHSASSSASVNQAPFGG